ncbi:MAG: SBBP repeat-containing protein [Sedimentisphaerales bacterium]|nr:SBBP repeat-containing protein [Sedimentisphaerales bacterium]
MNTFKRAIRRLFGRQPRSAKSSSPKVEPLEPRVLLDGAQLLWSTYVGNETDDFVYGIAVDRLNNVVVSVDTMVYAGGSNYNGGDSNYNGGDSNYNVAVLVGKITDDGQTMSWYTQLNGPNGEYPNRVAVDADGNIYVVGLTGSADLLSSSGGFDTTFGGGEDGFVVKLDPNGTVLWGTYLGGSGHDEAYGVAVAPDGNILVCGVTESGGWVSGGQYHPTQDEDAFLVQITSDGSQMLWGRYIGGSSYDEADSVAVDAQGNVYVVGLTESSGWVSGGFDTSYGGEGDGFLAKFDSSGNPLWSTYIGANYPEMVFDVAVGPDGNPVIAGASGPMGWIKGGWDTSFGGGQNADAFAGKINADGSGAVWGTYIGGSGVDWAHGVAVDPQTGDIVVCGGTKSAGWAKGGFDTTHNGNLDAFLVRLTGSGAHLWSSYLGGTAGDEAYCVAIDHNGDILVCGQTESAGWVDGGFDTTYHGGDIGADEDDDMGLDGDGFVAKIHQLPVNHAPQLTTIETLTDAQQDWPYQVTYEDLLGASDAQDPDGDQIQFILDSVSSGRLKDAQNNELSKGATLGPGQAWIWQPPASKNGLLNAFKVKASDGQQSSAAVQVKVQVGQIPDLQPTVVDSSVWQAAQIDDDIAWSVTVYNNGPVAQTEDWTVQWYLSTDNKLGATDILIGSETYSDDIPSKGTVEKQINAPVPQLAKAGQYYVIAKVINTGPDSNAKNDVKASKDRDWFGTVDPDAHEDNDSRETATELGYGAGTKTLTNRTIDQSGDEDWYKFTTLNTVAKGHKIQLNFTNTEGDLALALYDQTGHEIVKSDGTGNTEQIALTPLALGEGTYYVKVWSDHGDVSCNYTLTIAVPAGPDLQITKVDSNVWQSAEVGTQVDWTATIKNNGTGNQRADWTVSWYLSTDNKFQADKDIPIGTETYDDPILAKASIDVTYSAEVPAIPTAGQYYVIGVVRTDGPETNVKNNTKASTDRDWFGTVAPDTCEDNDSQDAAWDLGNSKVTLDNLTLDDDEDEDWYRFELPKQGTSSSKIQIDFVNAEGDLVLELYDEAGILLKQVDTTANSHRISLNKQPAGVYYVRVLAHQAEGFLTDVCRKYKLTLTI